MHTVQHPADTATELQSLLLAGIDPDLAQECVTKRPGNALAFAQFKLKDRALRAERLAREAAAPQAAAVVDADGKHMRYVACGHTIGLSGPYAGYTAAVTLCPVCLQNTTRKRWCEE